MLPMGMIPDTGFIYPGVAAGFVYTTNTQVAIIEGYYTNPQSTKEERDTALNEITEALLRKITLLGVKYVKCDSCIPAVIERAKRFGFKDVGTFTSLFKEL